VFFRHQAQPRFRRLHMGCGKERIDGWLNVDIQILPGVDLVADATRGLGLRDLEAVYAEHFLEHLEVEDAISFLCDMHRALQADGVLRLSTPNLDWVWITHYGLHDDRERKRAQAIMLNRAFRGWHHRFLWNRELLGQTLAACGFEGITWHRHGESARAVFRGLERHETYEDTAELPHVIIAEASKGPEQPAALAALRDTLYHEYLVHRASM
jgi:predicted SAM-dependent methyltransferase